MSNGTLKVLHSMFADEIYDTDSVKQDISEFVENDDDDQTSNIYAKIVDQDVVMKMKQYWKSAEGKSSVFCISPLVAFQ